MTGPPPAMEATMEAMEAAAATERFRRLLLTKSKDFVSILMTSVLCLFFCVFVCLFVGTITRERKKLPMSNYTT